MKTNLKQENEELKQIIKDIFWMSRRYAHGCSTYAPSIVREAYNKIIKLGIDIQHDVCITAPNESEIGGMRFRYDYLDDTNVSTTENNSGKVIK